jgi:hypothetical protein
LLALCVVGCGHHVFSPPARLTHMRTPQPVGAGQLAVRIQGGYDTATFGPTLAAGGVGLRRGLTDQLELELEGTLQRVLDEGSAGTDPDILAARAGVSWTVPGWFDILAVGAGLGGGVSAGGSFISPDLNLVGAYENPYVIPFQSLSPFLSVPLDARVVDLSDPEDPLRTHLDQPVVSYGIRTAAGIRVPISDWGNLYGLLQMGLIADVDGEQEGFTGVGAGLELRAQ